MDCGVGCAIYEREKNIFSNSTALKGLGGWLLEKGLHLSVRANLVTMIQPYASLRRVDYGVVGEEYTLSSNLYIQAAMAAHFI